MTMFNYVIVKNIRLNLYEERSLDIYMRYGKERFQTCYSLQGRKIGYGVFTKSFKKRSQEAYLDFPFFFNVFLA